MSKQNLEVEDCGCNIADLSLSKIFDLELALELVASGFVQNLADIYEEISPEDRARREQLAIELAAAYADRQAYLDDSDPTFGLDESDLTDFT